jgi:hypothetical protein
MIGIGAKREELDTFDLLTEETYLALKQQCVNHSNILLYGGLTMKVTPTIREEQDLHAGRTRSSRIINFMSITRRAEVYKLVVPEHSPSLIPRQASLLERDLVDAIPLCRRLNSSPGGILFPTPAVDGKLSLSAGNECEYWLPPLELDSLRRVIDDSDSVPLRSPCALEGRNDGTSSRSLVMQLVNFFAKKGMLSMDPESLKVVIAMRGGDGYSTYAGRCMSMRAFSWITLEGIHNVNHIGRSFDTLKYLKRLVNQDCLVDNNDDIAPVGMMLDIYGITPQIHWGANLLFFSREFTAIDPLFSYSWGNLEAALWFRYEAFADDKCETPEVPLKAHEMFEAVGNLFVARHGSSYHLHLCDYHAGVISHRPKLRSLYLSLSYCLLLYEKLVLGVLKAGLREGIQAGSKVPVVTDLTWFQERRKICYDHAASIGLIDAIEGAKSKLRAHSRVDAILVNSRVDRVDAILVNSTVGNNGNKPAHKSTDVDSIPESASIRDWDLVTLGEPGSCEREEQVSEIERDAHDRAARGVDPDPYRIRSGDNGFSYLLDVRQGIRAKDYLNGRGRTEAGQARAAANWAQINSPAAILKRTPDVCVTTAAIQ